jgi:hypothetical protein
MYKSVFEEETTQERGDDAQILEGAGTQGRYVAAPI